MIMANRNRLRILHVVGSLDRAGVPNWLLDVMRAIDRERFRFDFVVHEDRKSSFDDEIRSLGGTTIACPRRAGDPRCERPAQGRFSPTPNPE